MPAALDAIANSSSFLLSPMVHVVVGTQRSNLLRTIIEYLDIEFETAEAIATIQANKIPNGPERNDAHWWHTLFYLSAFMICRVRPAARTKDLSIGDTLSLLCSFL